MEDKIKAAISILEKISSFCGEKGGDLQEVDEELVKALKLLRECC